MDPVQRFDNAWKEEMVPLLNGVTYPDGRWFRISSTDDQLAVNETRWDTRDMDDEWTYFTELCRKSVPGDHHEVAAGEGGLGTDGVVALIDSRNNTLRWALFMDWSNPFDQLEIAGETIVAKTTLGTLWTLDLQCPENASVLSMASD